MNKKYLIPVATLAAVCASAFGVLSTSAHGAEIGTEKTITQRLAEKFSLKESDVAQVFTEHKADMHAKMQIKIEDRLTQLVKDGKITEEQKQKILAKQKELADQHESLHEKLKDMTPEERKAEMEKQRTSLEAWAKENGIDTQYLKQFAKAGPGLTKRHHRF